MKVESPELDKQALARCLQTTYGLDVERLAFVPKGEESYSYIATTHAGQSYFIKVHLASPSPQLEACYRFVHTLRSQEGCEWLVAPHLTIEGGCLGTLGKYAVALFDHVSGVTKAPSELCGPQMAQFAGQLLYLHTSIVPALLNGLPKETFTISFKGWLLEVLAAVEQPLQRDHARSQAAYDLIRLEKPQILRIIADLEEIATHLQSADLQHSLPQAVTHGDLASHNIIQDEHDSLLLIDWGKLSLAPAERDLVALWEDGNAALLSAYFEGAGATPPSRQALTYYLYHNLLATVTDYGSWLLLEDASPEEAENAWMRLSQALPLDLHKVQTTVEAIDQLASRQPS